MSDSAFYTNLPVVENYSELADSAAPQFTPAPDSSTLAVTDVERSAQAVEKGLYKEVNLVNASAILTILNVCGFEEVPFIFGGDGTTALVPPEHSEAVHCSLLAAREMARKEFGLRLRIGMLPVSAIRQLGRDLLWRTCAFRLISTRPPSQVAARVSPIDSSKRLPGTPLFKANPSAKRACQFRRTGVSMGANSEFAGRDRCDYRPSDG